MGGVCEPGGVLVAAACSFYCPENPAFIQGSEISDSILKLSVDAPSQRSIMRTIPAAEETENSLKINELDVKTAREWCRPPGSSGEKGS